MGLVVVKAFFIKYLLAPLMIALLALVLGILKKKTPSVKGCLFLFRNSKCKLTTSVF